MIDLEQELAQQLSRRASAARPLHDVAAVIDELYLAALSRLPTDTERNETLQYRAECESREAWLEDVLWSLVNVREFVFIH